MNRKEFIFSSSLAALSISILGVAGANANNKSSCATTNDILGPFYRPNAPLRNNLENDQTGGTAITIKGIVYGTDCKTPIKNALVEIWHANSKGDYDNDSDKYKNRARWKTDKKGAYSFKTILPGKYLNGRLYRPAHVHFKVSGSNQKTLVSQLYFAGDPHIKEDPWAGSEKAKHRIHPIQPVGVDGTLTITFDIFME